MLVQVTGLPKYAVQAGSIIANVTGMVPVALQNRCRITDHDDGNLPLPRAQSERQ
jgi:hypothetical protein